MLDYLNQTLGLNAEIGPWGQFPHFFVKCKRQFPHIFAGDDADEVLEGLGPAPHFRAGVDLF